MKNIFLENSLFKNDKEKEIILKNQLRLKNIFWMNFIGFVALRKAYPENQKILNFFKTDLRIQIDKITDNNNDFSLVVKLFYDAGFLPSSIVNKITKFLFIMKTGKLVDEQLFRDNILKDIYTKAKISKIKGSKKIMTYVNDFYEARKSLTEILPFLFELAITNKKYWGFDFIKLARPLITADSMQKKIVKQDQKNVIDNSNKKIAAVSKTSIKKLVSSSKLDKYLENISRDSSIVLNEKDKNAILLKLMNLNDVDGKILLEEFNLKKTYIKNEIVSNFYSSFQRQTLLKDLIEFPFITPNFWNFFIPNYFENFSKGIKYKFIYCFNIFMDDVYSEEYAKFFYENDGVESLSFHQIKIDPNKYLQNILSYNKNRIFDPYVLRDFNDNYYAEYNDETLQMILNLKDGEYFFKNCFRLYDSKKIEHIRKFLLKRGILFKFTTLSKDELSLLNYNIFSNIIEDTKSLSMIKFQYLKQSYGTSDILDIIQLNNYWDDFERSMDDPTFIKKIIEYMHSTNSIEKEPINKKFWDIIIKKSLKNSVNDTFLIFLDYKNQKFNSSFLKKILSRYEKDFRIYTENNEKDFRIYTKNNKYSFLTFSHIIIPKLQNFYNMPPFINNPKLFYNYYIKNNNQINLKEFIEILETIILSDYKKIKFEIDEKIKSMSKNEYDYSNQIQKFLYFCLKYTKTIPEWLYKILEDKFDLFFLMNTAFHTDYNLPDKVIEYIFKNLKETKKKVKNYLIFSNSQIHSKKTINEFMEEISSGKKYNMQYKNIIEYIESWFNEIFNNEINKIKNDEFDVMLISKILEKEYPRKKEIIDILNKKIEEGKFLDYLMNDFSFYNKFFFNSNNSDYFIQNKTLILKMVKMKYSKDYSYSWLNFLEKIYDRKNDFFDEVINNIPDKSVQKTLLNKLKNNLLINNILKSTKKNAIIAPNTSNPKLIKGALEFNNFQVSSKIRLRKNETPTGFLERVRISKVEEIPKQKIEIIEMTQEEKDKKAIEWLDKNSAGVHGERFVKVLDSFTVDWPVDKYNEFKKEFPNTEMKGVFHGCGSIAASMVLRFGFNVKPISRTSTISVTGRMLGDGIYFAPNIDKVAAYCSDGGYVHHGDEIGYIFEMDVILGNKGYQSSSKPLNPNIHYNSAGTGSDSIRSPEYCIYWHEKQIKMNKVYRVQQTHVGYIKELKKKYFNRGE